MLPIHTERSYFRLGDKLAYLTVTEGRKDLFLLVVIVIVLVAIVALPGCAPCPEKLVPLSDLVAQYNANADAVPRLWARADMSVTLAAAATGRMGRPVVCESMMTPGWTTSRGPRGPSGVMARS